MLSTLGYIATQQANPKENNMKRIKQFPDYATTHTNAIITYVASYMILVVHRYASYISETNTRSRAGGNCFMSSDSPEPPNNGAILAISQIIKTVLSLAAEAKL